MNQILSNQNVKLERKNTDLTSFAFIASHDLKEPLRKIEMFSQRILQINHSHLDEKSIAYLKKIIVQGKRMQNLIDSVLQYAQTETAPENFKDVDLNKISEMTIESLSEIIEEKNAVIQIPSLPHIPGIPDQIEQLFTNLMENALKYSRSGVPPFIAIKASKINREEINSPQTSGSWKIDFCDNGIGFDETYGEKIFEIFQRLHNRDAYSGTGIGLAICKKIVENHGGSIEAKSVPGEGSVFSIIFPLIIQ